MTAQTEGQTTTEAKGDMKKKYPLDVKSVGEDTYIVMSKGHHDHREFMAAVQLYRYDWPLGMPQHLWVKATPCSPACGMHHCHYTLSDQYRKGWFPATYAHEAYGDDLYENVIAKSTGAKTP